MKLVQVAKFYHPEKGGIERVVQNVAEGMAARGHEVEVVTAVPSGRGGTDVVNGILVRRASSLGTVLSTPIAPDFPIRLERAARDADIVHYHLPNPLSAVSHVLTPDRGKVVVTYHSDIVRQQGALRFYQPVLYRILEAADRLITTSPRLRDRSEHLSEYADKTDVVPLSVDLSEIDNQPGTFKQKLNRPAVLFVGRLNYYKGTQYLIDAMQHVDAHLLIVGTGDRRDELESRASRHDLDGRIEFLGRVTDETLHELYEAADLFVLPSVEPSEAFGLVQVEAMAHGTPVINTSLPTGVPWVSKDGETGLTVSPRDSRALAEAMTTLLRDDRRRERLGKSARKRVESLFTRRQMLDSTEQIYRSVLRS